MCILSVVVLLIFVFVFELTYCFAVKGWPTHQKKCFWYVQNIYCNLIRNTHFHIFWKIIIKYYNFCRMTLVSLFGFQDVTNKSLVPSESSQHSRYVSCSTICRRNPVAHEKIKHTKHSKSLRCMIFLDIRPCLFMAILAIQNGQNGHFFKHSFSF